MASPPSSGLRRDLARVAGAGALLSPAEHARYGHDATIQRGLRGEPAAVVCPADAAAVARTVGWCYRHGVAVVPRGGGTGLAGGAVPVNGEVVLGLERLRGVRALEPGLWRLSVEAGLSTAHVARLAREHGLVFPPDPGAAELSHIGGNVATNAGGPHAFKYGRTGAWVTGLEVVLAPGELSTVGGEARRDAAAYDLTGLLVGSEGTLGVITAVQLRLAPAPESAVALTAVLPDPGAGQEALLAVLASGLQPAVIDFLDARAFALAGATFPAQPTGPDVPSGSGRRGPPRGPAGAAPVGHWQGLEAGEGLLLVLELDGSAHEVEVGLAELAALLAEAGCSGLARPRPAALWRWREGLNGVMAGVRGGKVSEDVCVPPERLSETVEGVHAIGARHSLPACAWGHAGDGIVHATFLLDPTSDDERTSGRRAGEEVLAMALSLGGSITGEHGAGWVKRDYLGLGWDPAALAAHRRVKDAFDPDGRLNPGKKTPSRRAPAR